MMDDTFERDLRSALAKGVPMVAPASLRAVVLETPSARPLRSVLARVAVLAVAAVMVASVAVVVGYATTRPADVGGRGGSDPAAIRWQTRTVSFAASSIIIDAGSQRFFGSPDSIVRSDPGSPTYTTLEVTWREQGTEMRLNFYLAADETTWWVSEIRTYDGRPTGSADWITYRGVFFRTPLDQLFLGDVDLSSSEGHVAGRLSIDHLSLGFTPLSLSSMEGCLPAISTPPAGDGPIGIERGVDPALGLDPSMTPQEIGARLRALGLCHTYRYEFLELNAGQIWCRPPDGKIREFLYGSQGEVLVFVDAERTPAQAPTQLIVGC